MGADGRIIVVEHVRETIGSDTKRSAAQIFSCLGMWWELRMLLYMCSDASTDSSHALYQEYSKGENATYVWNWGNHRNGSFVFEEQPTSLSRYVIDFRGNLQTNGDNGRRRSIRIVWIDQDDEEPRYTGQKLQQ